MTLEDRAREYARAHLQPVRIVWVDAEVEIYDAVGAVDLCSDRSKSDCIIAAIVHDKELENLLNRLIDGE